MLFNLHIFASYGTHNRRADCTVFTMTRSKLLSVRRKSRPNVLYIPLARTERALTHVSKVTCSSYSSFRSIEIRSSS